MKASQSCPPSTISAASSTGQALNLVSSLAGDQRGHQHDGERRRQQAETVRTGAEVMDLLQVEDRKYMKLPRELRHQQHRR